ncbi:uncharacterized protein LOC123305577 [Chrysoperla carnea]|uniref:uncharacterized protein LOC123305577 n=1 Tax=Chrysoperla carnea TaxID=189513 RepID=UPI001D09915F|nr:uncharacterized protein LOC123305577 [Chrysoperla carnea]
MEVLTIARTTTRRPYSTSVLVNCVWVLVTIVSLILEECWSLRDVRLLVIPSAIERGENVIFLCQYDLEGAPLYAVSWYRGTHEFYRHTPSEIPAIKIFKTNGIYVDETLSNSTQVVLSDVSYSLSGNFSCEVTTDAPSFSTRTASSQLTVIDTPKRPPILMVERDRYTLGDILHANCTSPPSRPPADIIFKINGIKVSHPHSHK